MYREFILFEWATEKSPPAADVAMHALEGDNVATNIFFTDILSEENYKVTSIEKGKKYFFKTCTHFYIGEVEHSDATVIVLKGGNCWVPQVGRLYIALTEGRCDEVEKLPCRTHIVAGALVAVYDWDHPIPASTTTPENN